jgi:8-oxo-dGTP diphosphatase
MAVAFIEHKNQWLMMKRHKEHQIAGGVYAPVGGHLNPDEFSNPVDACLREIREETKIPADKLENVRLKYIILRRKDTEIRIQYVYFMTSKTKEVISNNEGELEWIDVSDILEKQTTFTTHEVIKHYLTQSTYEEPVLVGTVDSEPKMHFVNIEDFDHPYLK